jgi:hypothetical protein
VWPKQTTNQAGEKEASELLPQFVSDFHPARWVLFLCATLLLAASASAQTEPPLTNAAVIKLVHAGFKDKTVVAIVRTRPSHFDLTPDRLIELKKSGVSENVILAMIAHEGLSNDLAFDDSLDDMAGPAPKRSADGDGVDIFGSNGSSSGRSRSRGQSGSNQNDTTTTGSITAHIIRPPAEEGGSPKLEKTPTLSNESIVGMVEAGFSEGTIIRRIERSPADFDLNASKLADLRKHRVTEPVINAMRAAMGDDTNSVRPTTPPVLKNPDN